jgi:hypothetical protein
MENKTEINDIQFRCCNNNKDNHLELLKKLIVKKKSNPFTCEEAAYGGHLECLKYLHENNYPWDWDTPYYAAMEGHLECLKYAHENRCPWNEHITEYASRKGHFECLKYAVENGCPMDKISCIEQSILNCHLECVKYLQQNGCQLNRNNNQYWVCAMINSDYELLSYLLDNGCRFDIKDAIGHGVIFTDCEGKQLGENDFNKEDVKKPGFVFAKMAELI